MKVILDRILVEDVRLGNWRTRDPYDPNVLLHSSEA